MSWAETSQTVKKLNRAPGWSRQCPREAPGGCVRRCPKGHSRLALTGADFINRRFSSSLTPPLIPLYRVPNLPMHTEYQPSRAQLTASTVLLAPRVLGRV